MNILFFDTETTGLINKSLADTDNRQPRLVQLAAVLCSLTGDELMSMSCIVKPNGFEIPEQASNVHGITTEIANEVGIDLNIAIQIFEALYSKCNMIVAHNYFFDKVVMNNERSRFDLQLFDREFFCTMLATTNICKIPNKFGKYKWPKLIEAHVHFFNEGFEGAHNALADVQACKRIYFELLNRGIACRPTGSQKLTQPSTSIASS